MEQTKNFKWSYLLIGVLFILVSLAAFNNPQSSLIAVVYIFAFTAIMKGIFELFFRRKLHQFTGYKSTTLTIEGVFDLIIGFLLLFNTSIGLVTLPFIFALWFIADSVGSLSTASIYKSENPGYYWFTVIVNGLGIILGIMLFFNPITSALAFAFLVGIYFMMIGISLVVYAFN